MLTGAEDAFVIDIGGTTLDFASMEKGSVAINNEGSAIGVRQENRGTSRGRPSLRCIYRRETFEI